MYVPRTSRGKDLQACKRKKQILNGTAAKVQGLLQDRASVTIMTRANLAILSSPMLKANWSGQSENVALPGKIHAAGPQ